MSALRFSLLNERCPAHPRAGGAERHFDEIFARLVAPRGEAECIMWLCTGTQRASPQDLPSQVLPSVAQHRGLRIERLGQNLGDYYLSIPDTMQRRVASGEVDLIIEAHNKLPFFSPIYCFRVPVLVIHHHYLGRTAFWQGGPNAVAGTLAAEKLIPRGYGSTRFLTISESSSQDLTARGLSPDNGSTYQSEVLAVRPQHERVNHLRSPTHTPTDNARAMHAMRRLKGETGLGRAVVLDWVSEPAELLEAARRRLNGGRLRAGLGWRPALGRKIAALLVRPVRPGALLCSHPPNHGTGCAAMRDRSCPSRRSARGGPQPTCGFQTDHKNPRRCASSRVRRGRTPMSTTVLLDSPAVRWEIFLARRTL